mmetsp:Transcript_26240/g.56272  ORF Transcript_26240/g.56272 Transcript_26240/m.56272 type:complete len:1100 (+) Transcript_26240:50-3349(+)|eukprot:CAMPEP_0201218988 /NCGR_PEP_ID=MMETSP0851-20130426/190854_1 /ASSEMBLY_ACC=CAM_ASM_000631 /TAXON_ID=183588 /ORGANISM="Pseudo-nitzschia fraudulenta, Strain WWA7" /LENGTH=1099 /DNA_ID=CAMNT_0047508677 /DNA_START=665 /DNA_END=3964 /DNA_ORIENTATION=-
MAETVYSAATATSRTGSLNSVTWKSGINFFSRDKSLSGGNNSLKKFRRLSIGTASKSTGTGSNSQPNHSNTNTRTKRKIDAGRFVLFVVLLGSAIGLGYASYRLMEHAGSRLAKDRFLSISKRAAANAEWVVREKKQATDALAKMYGSANPDSSAWPYVYMEGYQDIASSLRLITKGSLSFCPIVKGFGGDEHQRFEEYYYNLYDEWGYPNGTGVSAFGKGIYGFGYDINNYKAWSDWRYPVLNNLTKHGLPNPENIMVPFVQSDFGNHSALMLDVFFEYYRAKTVQTVMDCAEERRRLQDPSIDCASITDMLWQNTNAVDVDAGPAGIFFSPIYPLNDRFNLTGFILHKQIWYDLLLHAFESDVSGIRIVLHTNTGKEHTYEVENGNVHYIGNRTHHCIAHAIKRNEYVDFGSPIECEPDDEWIPFEDLYYLQEESHGDYRSLNNSITEDIFTEGTVEYYMDIYATKEFVSQYGRFTGSGEFSDSNDGIPISIMACIAIVIVMVFTSLLFVSYDYFVRQEFDSKNKLLEAKRRFVRFVSHEVRTPLNTVCMGLTLLENDMATAVSGSSDSSRNGSFSVGSSQAVNHHEKYATAKNSSTSSFPYSGNNDEDVVVLKREIVEEWMHLSTQVFENADAAVGVLSDLLNYDKIQMGTLSLELSLINLWTALEKTVEEFQMAAKEKFVSLNIDLSPLVESSFLPISADNNTSNSTNATTAIVITNGCCDEEAPPSGTEGSLHEKKKAKSIKASDLPAKIKNCKVVGDKIRLIQVFRNLISNGLKFSKECTSMTVRVSVDSLPERKQKPEKLSLHKGMQADVIKIGSVSIEVIDQGVGMTKEQVDTVFEDGTQFDANKLQAGGGSGLGLNIARGIVLEHGGSLTCSSDGIGKGTTFTLSTTLFFDETSAANKTGIISDCIDQVSEDEEQAADSSEFSIPLLHVLVVDDSVTNRKLCQRLLQKNGHTTEGAADGAEAVRMVKESLKTGKFYDCILLDYEMPVMNGPDACQLIRKMGCSSYIAGVTGNVMSEDVDHFRNCGANWVLPKPFQLKALEDQWVEDGVTPFTQMEKSGENMVRVESSQALIEMGDGLAVTFDPDIKSMEY